MTALTFLIVLIAAGVHWYTRGYFVLDGITIYVAAFVATLSTASMFALISRDRHCVLGALVLVANFAGSHWAWHTDNVLVNCALLDLATAAWFAIYGVSRWEFTAASIFLVSVATSGLTQLGVIPDSTMRPDVYIAWSHPDITAILGHMASITLGLGAGDAGYRIGLALRRRSVAADYRFGFVSRLAGLAKGSSTARD